MQKNNKFSTAHKLFHIFGIQKRLKPRLILPLYKKREKKDNFNIWTKNKFTKIKRIKQNKNLAKYYLFNVIEALLFPSWYKQ